MNAISNVDYSVMPTAELYGVLKASEKELQMTKAAHATILQAVGSRFSAAVTDALTRDGRPSGTFRGIQLGDGFTANAEVDKTVKWEQDKLKAVAAGMTWEEVCHYFKIDFSMSEAIYKALPPGDLKKSVDGARITKYGEPKLTIVPPAEALQVVGDGQ